jgi:hypothetical protein
VSEDERDQVDQPVAVQPGGDLRALLDPQPPGHELVGRQPRAHGHVVAGVGADRLEHLEREAQPGAERAIVAVGAAIAQGREELRRQVAV